MTVVVDTNVVISGIFFAGPPGRIVQASVAGTIDLICDDPDDDKFLACALASGARIIVTGDKALLRLDGFRRLSMVRPRQFVDANLG